MEQRARSRERQERTSRLMRRKFFGLALSAMLFALCFAAHAQQPNKFPRIGYLSTFDPAVESARAEGIRLALREFGYREGENIVIDYRFAEQKLDRLPELAAELVRLNVGIILVTGDASIRAAKNATKTIPIVMTGTGADPVAAGFVESLARPGDNVTGITLLGRELGGKRLELLKEAVGKVARVAALSGSASPLNAIELKEVQAAARALKLTIQTWEVQAADGFDKVFAALNKQRPDGLYVLGGGLMRVNKKRIVSFALKYRLPSMHTTREYVDAGGLMYYGADQGDSYRRVALYVDKILKGAKPADLPVEQPTKFELVINLKTAKQIGLTISPNVLARADKVIR
jgi:putative ABC transport system substrate-binding protein